MPVDHPQPQLNPLTDRVPEFRQIVDVHAGFLWRALRHLGVQERDVQDVCQEVFLVAYRRLGDFRGESTLRSWLYAIAIRLASEHRRRAHVRREIPTLEPPVEHSAPPRLDELEKSELRHSFNAALEQLDDDKRAVFVLYEIEDLDMKEVAVAVGCPIQTAYSRLHAARLQIAESIRAIESGLVGRRGT
jgi:RNA polymerase sigma-70 factor (ECF subfamily)